MSKQKFWNYNNSSELVIDGVIASESWYGDEVTPQLFREELSQHNGDLTVVINSPGGDVFAGVAIYNALKNRNDGKITVRVDGVAASIASVIAMAGDTVKMSLGSTMMIHKPWTFTAGDAEELAKSIELLNKLEESITDIYVDKTQLDKAKIKELLAAETWLSPEEAVQLGFADEAPTERTSLSDALKNVKDLITPVHNAVMQPMMSIKAKLVEEEANAPDTTTQTDEVVQPTTEVQTPVEADPTEVEEVEAEPETVTVEEPVTEVTEPVAEKIKPVVKEKNKVSTEIAESQVMEPKAQAPVDATPKVTVKDYLKTKASMEAFAEILAANPAADLEDKDASSRVRAAWKKHLEVKAGVTNPEIFLPTPLIQEIEDAFKAGGEIWNRVSKTGMDAFNAAWDANDDPDAQGGRAQGYRRSEAEDKREQTLTIANRILRPQFVYKYITLNREDVKEQRSTGALVRFVLSELPKRIIREVERAIVIGDGRASNDDYKILEGNPRGFFPVKADATAGNAFASTYVPVAGQTVYETLRRARSLVKADGGVILVAKEGLLLDMEFEQNANGGFLFAPGSDLSRYIKVDAVVEPDWMENDSNDAYIFAYGYYRVVGDLSVEAFQNFILKTNKNEYLQEIWAGGGLTALKSGVAIAPAAES